MTSYNKGIGDRAFVQQTSAGVQIRNLDSGDVVATLQDPFESAAVSSCSCLTLGGSERHSNSRVMYVTTDVVGGGGGGGGGGGAPAVYTPGTGSLTVGHGFFQFPQGQGRVYAGPQSSINICSADTGQLMSIISTGRLKPTALATPLSQPWCVLAGGAAGGLKMFDTRLESGEVQRFESSGGGATRAIALDDGWKVVAGAAKEGYKEATLMLDRRMLKMVWDISSTVPITNVAFTEECLVYSSCKAAVSHDAVERGWSLNAMDFGADADMTEDRLPFSSTYDNIAGFRYNDLLATPYDNVLPNRFG